MRMHMQALEIRPDGAVRILGESGEGGAAVGGGGGGGGVPRSQCDEEQCVEIEAESGAELEFLN